jgi:hypothetical protein
MPGSDPLKTFDAGEGWPMTKWQLITIPSGRQFTRREGKEKTFFFHASSFVSINFTPIDGINIWK